MTDHLDDLARSDRRSVFGRLAVFASLAAASFTVPAAAAPANDGPAWPGKLKARHRQVVDAAEPDDGNPLAYASTFLTSNAPGAAVSVIVLRHIAMPLALDSALWAKYRIGESMKIVDPETHAPAIKNPWLRPKPGVLNFDAMALDQLLAAGTIFGVCNVALQGISTRLAPNAHVSPEEAAREWAANLIPGMALLPSGVWAVNRAQEAGCTYCAG